MLCRRGVGENLFSCASGWKSSFFLNKSIGEKVVMTKSRKKRGKNLLQILSPSEGQIAYIPAIYKFLKAELKIINKLRAPLRNRI